MGDDPKYVVVVNEYGNEVPIVFQNTIDHARIAKGFKEVLAAGFMSFNPTVCYGRSVTLNCQSRGEIDSRLIDKAFNLRQ